MHCSRVLSTVAELRISKKKFAKEHQQRSFDAAASICSTAYLDIGGFRQQREQVLSHVLVHMQPAAVGGARDEALHRNDRALGCRGPRWLSLPINMACSKAILLLLLHENGCDAR